MDNFNIDILCLQETAHLNADQSRLVNIFSPYISYWSNDPHKLGVGQGFRTCSDTLVPTYNYPLWVILVQLFYLR